MKTQPALGKPLTPVLSRQSQADLWSTERVPNQVSKVTEKTVLKTKQTKRTKTKKATDSILVRAVLTV